ncbi:AraC family transcriptional regulator [Anaerosporobacter faecicola]|uniref:AraC family transcriptional regulator n=1 Tax=Anaerosporobacter faecicola TaxID=2718714 RepID=UPI00143AFA32|nr:AraC family transcriptional regulator [Anaerosporobacter faecicola]
MEWIERLNQAMNYIEEHLKEDVNYEELGKIACCSSYHFQRMFAYMADVPLPEYIRRRKMSLAAVDLQSGDEKIIDVALRYGYQSPTAFNRAFQSVHGIAPSFIKQGGISVKSFPPMRFQIMIKGVDEMNYRIEKKEEIRIVGISKPLEKEIEKNFETVPQMWQKATTDGTIPRLLEKMDGEIQGLLGVSACTDQEQWSYYIAVASTKDKEDFEEYVIPAATWAVFEGEGMSSVIQELERRIVLEWLPTSGYEYANGPDMEVYISPDPEHAKFEVWIPVVKKSER